VRREDIVLLAGAFLQEFAKENERPVKPLTDAAMEVLLAYSWPGNVRELRTVIEHGVVMSNDAVIDIRHLPRFLLSSPPPASLASVVSKIALDAAPEFNLHALETNAIRAALSVAKGNRTHAADLLGVSRRTLQRKLKELGL
jgi:DNA-binding NtrC family response regulator